MDYTILAPHSSPSGCESDALWLKTEPRLSPAPIQPIRCLYQWLNRPLRAGGNRSWRLVHKNRNGLMKDKKCVLKASQRSLHGHPTRKMLAVVVIVIEWWPIAAKCLACGPLVLAISLAKGPIHLKLAEVGLYPFQPEVIRPKMRAP